MEPHIGFIDLLIDSPYRLHASPVIFAADYMDPVMDYIDPLMDYMDPIIDYMVPSLDFIDPLIDFLYR